MHFYNTYVLLYLFCEEYMDTTKSMVGLNIKDEDVCLVDSATTHSIFKSKK